MKPSIFDTGLERNAANFAALSPIPFIEHAAAVFPDRLAVVHGSRRFTWRTTYARSRRLASALRARGVERGDTVAAMLANTPEMFEAHFGVPMIGAILNALNTRLDADAIAFMLNHGEAKVVLVDREFAPTIKAAVAKADRAPLIIDVDDPEYDGVNARIGEFDYESFLSSGDPNFAWQPPDDEWDAIALNYTSGTTGNPKGVVYSHRGTYLSAVGNLLAWAMPHHSVYLWTLPMFHCNGWTFPWALAANAGTSVCLRKIDPALIFKLIRDHRVTHFCGAPIVHATLINAPSELRDGITHTVAAFVAGAAPPAAMIEAMETIGFALTHVYGLTEVSGPAAFCPAQESWSELTPSDRAAKNGRQGVRYVTEEGMAVMDPATMREVPADGQTMGEIMFRGNMTMKGYLKNPTATQDAFAGGWFHTGDLAVLHPDGYAKIKDRSKDIIISGGENISSIELEDVLTRHPAVFLAAVVAKPDPKWGETPCAFVELKQGATATESEIIAFCREHIATFKAPRAVVFGVLPKTSTGKIQKFVLREQAKSTNAIDR